MTVLAFKAAWRVFELPAESITAVAGATLELNPGDFAFVHGHSGSGKTTLLNLAAGLDVPTRGHVAIHDSATSEMSESQRVDLRKVHVGMVHQMDYLIPELSVEENVSLVQRLTGVSSVEARAEALELLALVGIAELADRLPRQLSGGQRQRVGVARALAGDRGLIVADEPTGSLDSRNSLLIFELMARLAEDGRCVLMASHDERAAQFATLAFEMVDGRLERR